MAVQIGESLEGIDWDQVKTDLAADNFDNGRSPQALHASFARSAHVAIARDGDRVVGMARLLSDGVCNAYLRLVADLDEGTWEASEEEPRRWFGGDDAAPARAVGPCAVDEGDAGSGAHVGDSFPAGGSGHFSPCLPAGRRRGIRVQVVPGNVGMGKTALLADLGSGPSSPWPAGRRLGPEDGMNERHRQRVAVSR